MTLLLVISAIVAVLCGASIFGFCRRLDSFHSFLGFTLIFDGLFGLLSVIIFSASTEFNALLYVLNIVMMLAIPFLYYFACIFLLKEKGVSYKDYWMLEILLVFATILTAVLFVIPSNDKILFQQILSGRTGISSELSSGVAVLLALDSTAFAFFLAEMLFVQIFCAIGLFRYKRDIENYFSNESGKSIDLISIIFVLVGIRFIAMLLQLFLPAIVSSNWYLASSCITSSAFYILVTFFAFKIQYSAEDIRRQVEQASKAENGLSSNVNELIRSKFDNLVANKFFLNPDTDLIGLSCEIHVNCKYICEYLKNTYGETFMVFVNRLRIEYSEQLLNDKKLTIDDIAEQSGFISTSTFYRNFIKVHGTSPSKFKKNQ